MEKGWSLTACLIVKNEEHCLGDCLNSIKEWVDQIVVVDTGSTDNTVQVARQYDAQIEYFLWKDDFAAARNYSLQFAEGDWILVLDADERIEGDLTILSDLVAKDYEGYYLTVKSSLGTEKIEVEDYVVRLFRNGRGYKFIGAIHEQIAGSIKERKGQDALAFSGIIVSHRGYEPEEILRKQKMVRNSQIIKTQLARRQDDTFMLYSLGTELIQQEKYGEACKVLMKALRHMSGGEGYFREVILLVLMASLKNGAYIETEDLFVKSLAMMPADRDILFLAGLRQAALGNYRLAGELFNKGGINTVLVPPQLLYAIVGELFFRQGIWQEAVIYFMQSLEAAPSLYSVVRLIEVIKQGEAGAAKNLADAMGENFARLAQEAFQKEAYYAAAAICLVTMNKDGGQNFDQCKSIYQSVIKQADKMPTSIKGYLEFLFKQMEICSAVLVNDKKCQIAQNYLAQAANRSLRVWLTLWPEHIMPKSIWEYCL
ncbi:SPBc2 prophage-derived glycosyltransferase SunS [Sporomusa ovata DSM 2662]|uniref:Glycosyltransferase fused to TPR-repeat domain n=1 Tax=Sporomusa ovata TaxID=2378 RepID=A0A0U1KUW0_9FIRM|nr:glycosyltransferase family 2 protein [Sporomusa ovata]EQB27111.1 glycosyl transferase family 2 [Sporomusa ovata DSM 2662]CQR71212.1 Glycosyltransferase fused to TPR-repeat domain [Sporomusa ovata]